MTAAVWQLMHLQMPVRTGKTSFIPAQSLQVMVMAHMADLPMASGNPTVVLMVTDGADKCES